MRRRDAILIGATPVEVTDGLAAALGRVGDRWTLQIVHSLLDGPRRFNDLSEDVRGIAPNVLSQRLRQLEADRLIVASAYSRRPVRYAYELTATGSELAGALRLLSHWGGGRPVLHQACGTTAEPRWWCATCDQVLDDGEVDEVTWL